MNNFAIVFPGQGVQYIGMLNSFENKFNEIKYIFDKASNILNYDLWKLIKYGAENELNKTYKAQPAILVTSIAIWKILKKYTSYKPKIISGHSLGEYTALVCAEALKFNDAVKLVKLRGKYMQKAINNNGGMSAIIGLNANIIDYICKICSQNEIVSLANLNSNKQVVISGNNNAIKKANILCKILGGVVKPLKISIPAHCILMLPAAIKLKEILDRIDIYTPKIPIINNVDNIVEKRTKFIKNALIRQIYSPINWIKSIKYISNIGIKIILELGPKNILSKLNKNIDKNILSIPINNFNSIFNLIKNI